MVITNGKANVALPREIRDELIRHNLTTGEPYRNLAVALSVCTERARQVVMKFAMTKATLAELEKAAAASDRLSEFMDRAVKAARNREQVRRQEPISLSTPIPDLPLDAKVRNALLALDLKTLGDALSKTDRELRYPGLGKVGLQRVRALAPR